jgi:hypothetical protein
MAWSVTCARGQEKSKSRRTIEKRRSFADHDRINSFTTEAAGRRGSNGERTDEARRVDGADMGRSCAAPLRRNEPGQDARIEERFLASQTLLGMTG